MERFWEPDLADRIGLNVSEGDIVGIGFGGSVEFFSALDAPTSHVKNDQQQLDVNLDSVLGEVLKTAITVAHRQTDSLDESGDQIALKRSGSRGKSK